MSNAFVLFEERIKKNIRHMVDKAKRNQITLRPHFKTHQNPKVAEWFKEEGVLSITVSSLNMAQRFAQQGWKDIFIAFPLDINEVESLDQLASQVKLRIIINNLTALQCMKNLNHPLDFMIEIDAGYHRTGIDFRDEAHINLLIEESKKLLYTNFLGFAAHFGNTYKARNRKQIEGIAHKSINRLWDLCEKTEREQDSMVMLSIGDTPTCSVLSDFPEIVDEIRPGNFVFYDQMQLQIGSCTLDQVGALMRCPVVEKRKNELIIHGGAVHFSLEKSDYQGENSYGFLVDISEKEWKLQSSFLSQLSQEHGIIQCSNGEENSYQIGDFVYVLPVHSCLTANLMQHNTLVFNQT